MTPSTPHPLELSVLVRGGFSYDDIRVYSVTSLVIIRYTKVVMVTIGPIEFDDVMKG